MRIVVAADSLALPRPAAMKTWYPGSPEELAVRPQDTYSELLERDLRQGLGQDVRVMNRGVRHRTMLDVAADVNDLVHFLEPDVLVVHVGIVDCWLRAELGNRSRVPLEEFSGALRSVISHMRLRPLARLVLVGICPTSQKMEDRTPGLLDTIARYDEVLRRAAEEHRCSFVDMAEHVSRDELHTYLLPDDQHLNRAGNRLLASLLGALLVPPGAGREPAPDHLAGRVPPQLRAGLLHDGRQAAVPLHQLLAPLRS